MLSETEVNDAITRIATMGRPALIEALQTYDARFPVDFTDDFLCTADEDRLRHIFVALVLHCQRMPEAAKAA
ncbi:MAG: hypothetical protein AAF743_15670 [Planctomycetota bacterium]